MTRIEIVDTRDGRFAVVEKRGDRTLVVHGTYRLQFVANQVAKDVEEMRRGASTSPPTSPRLPNRR